MRAALLFSWLPACTIGNTLDPALLDRASACENCVEEDASTCTNGQDDDLDGRTDCADSACAPLFECFTELGFERAERCPRARRPFAFSDGFDGPLANNWINFGGTAPSTVSVSGTNALRFSGLATRSKFGIGSEQLFDLSLSFFIREGCELEEQCALDIELHTRDDWESGALGGESIFAVELDASKDRGKVELSCSYHERPLDPGMIRLVSTDPSDRLQLDIETTLDGRIELRTQGEVLCRTQQLQPLEPEVRLVFRSSRREVLVSQVRLDVREEHVTEPCEGRTVSRGVLQDSYCRRDFEFTHGMSTPKVAVSPAGYELLFTGARAREGAIWNALSADGRRDFRLRRMRDAPAIDPSAEAGVYERAGGLIFRSGQLETYYTKEALYRAAAPEEAWNDEAPYSDYHEVDPASLSAPLDQAPPAELAVPETIVDRDGRRRVWFSLASIAAGGKRAIYTAESADGLELRAHEGAVLAPGPLGAWDHEGVYGPSVVFTGEYYLLAYAAKAFFGEEAIGLAASRDGIEWVRHPANPIFSGGDEGFDDGGVSDPSVLYEDGVLRIWYTATTYRANRCSDPALDTGVLTRIGLAELNVVF